MEHRPVYLDYNATTPVAPEVLEAVTLALRDAWGNASSAHVYGREAREAMDRARSEVAALIACEDDEIIFTSGGTESDNTAIVGVAEALADRGRHLVISAIEHAAVEKACAYLESRGWETTRVDVDANGRVSAGDVEAAIRPDTVLVSVMHANNETGVLQPVADIGARARNRGVLFHTDAAQSVGKLTIHVDDLNADLLTIAGHKLYAPKGVGALYVRRGTPFRGTMLGAPHETGRRSGTENVAGIVGLGAACRLARQELPGRTEHLRELRDRLVAVLRERAPDLVIHGGEVERLPNTLSVAFPGVVAVDLLSRAPGVASAAGAACHSGKAHVSSTLRAMGVEDDLALATVRLTVGCPTTLDEVDRAGKEIGVAFQEQRHSVP